MRWAIAAVLALAVPAVADKPKAKPPVATKAAKAAKSAPAAKCKMKFVGKGLERKAVCVFEEEIVVPAGPAKPAVVIAPIDGRKVTGRPKLTDPLAGLSRRRETAR